MDAAFLSFIASERTLETLKRVDPAPAIQTQRFAINMVKLLHRAFPDLVGYNFAQVQDYPRARKARFDAETFEVDGVPCQALPFVNLLVLKHLTRFLALLRRYREIRSKGFVIIHGLHLPYLVFGLMLKSRSCRVGLILTDEQGIIQPHDNLLRRALKRIDGTLAVQIARRYDFGIALSDGLADLYLGAKPRLVLPGIYSTELELRVRQAERDETRREPGFRALYFGNLSEDYGVKAFAEAAPLLPAGSSIRLFGRGPLEAALREQAAQDDRLHYGGLVDQDQLVEEMLAADILVNPRPAGTRLARMSSPSKLIEYAASGKPVLTTALPSIPPEILAHCYIIEKADPAGIAAALAAVARDTPERRAERGRRFRQAVAERYAVEALGESIAGLARSI